MRRSSESVTQTRCRSGSNAPRTDRFHAWPKFRAVRSLAPVMHYPPAMLTCCPIPQNTGGSCALTYQKACVYWQLSLGLLLSKNSGMTKLNAWARYVNEIRLECGEPDLSGYAPADIEAARARLMRPERSRYNAGSVKIHSASSAK